MDLIIYAHPASRASHNAVILDYVTTRLQKDKKQFRVLDLYTEKFDPLLRLVDPSSGTAGYSEEVKKYQKLVTDSDRLIFIYPIWWYNMPAVLKGFIDRVFTSGFAFNFRVDEKEWVRVEPLLKNKKAVVINTYGHGERLLREYGASSRRVLDDAVLKFCGIETRRVEWFDIKKAGDMPPDIKKKIDAALSG